jgi:hypothetical protein
MAYVAKVFGFVPVIFIKLYKKYDALYKVKNEQLLWR